MLTSVTYPMSICWPSGSICPIHGDLLTNSDDWKLRTGQESGSYRYACLIDDMSADIIRGPRNVKHHTQSVSPSESYHSYTFALARNKPTLTRCSIALQTVSLISLPHFSTYFAVSFSISPLRLQTISLKPPTTQGRRPSAAFATFDKYLSH